MIKPRNTGLTRVVLATRYSWQGLKAAWRHESAFRQECVLGLGLLPAAFLLGENLAQTALLIGVCVVVLIVELLNSAVEAVVDRIGPEYNDLAGQAKDMGSAAVMLSILLVWTTWILVAVHRLIG
jgi:diacylglycerol kinase (ATP)